MNLKQASNIEEIYKTNDIIITCLPGGKNVEHLYYKENAMSFIRRNQIIIDSMKSLSLTGDNILRKYSFTFDGSIFEPVGTTELALLGITVGTDDEHTFYITDIQLEEGDQATSFEYRPYGLELQLCQRYYQYLCKAPDDGSGYHILGMFNVVTSTEVRCCYNIQPMRATPSCKKSGNFQVFGSDLGTVDFNTIGFMTNEMAAQNGIFLLKVSTSSATIGNTAFIRASNDINAFVSLDAEL
jgi:hypothetical protein